MKKLSRDHDASHQSKVMTKRFRIMNVLYVYFGESLQKLKLDFMLGGNRILGWPMALGLNSQMDGSEVL